MKLVPIIALAVALGVETHATPNVASQLVTYQGFSNTVSCSGSHFQCTDGGAVCCSFPTGYGYSVQFNNLPAGGQGQGYTDGGCSNFLFALYGPGTRCWNGGGTSATNMNWFHSPLRGRRGESSEWGGILNVLSINCSAPNAFIYNGTDGVERRIKVPGTQGAAQLVADLYLASDFSTLSSFEIL